MILDQFKLDGKVAIVTGASRGIGQAAAVAFAEAGADVACVARTDMSDTLRQVQARGRRAVAISADLTSMDCVHTIIQGTLHELGRIDILLNNAGFARRTGVLGTSEDDWDSVMNVNLKVPFFLSQACARIWIEEKRGGKIINICSMLSYQGGIRVVSYTASKSGLLGLTRILANELAPHGINVNGIAPGYFATENTRPLWEDAARNAAILERIPAGRWGRPEDLAGALVFLSSPASDYMQASVIAVDGGWLAR